MKKFFCVLSILTVAAGGGVASAADYESKRPAERNFTSQAVEAKISEVSQALTNPYLRWMFQNCYPNTLDTTVHPGKDENGNPRTFVYTGDIHAMWLRDSGAQVWPYVELCGSDEALRNLIAGVINCQFSLICKDPYANAFNDGPTGDGWQKDNTKMQPDVFERKWEIDSDCYPIRLAYGYWKATGDESVFGDTWLKAIRNIMTTFKDQQRKEGRGSYKFERETTRQLDTKSNDGWGNPVRPVGLIASAFRPSDDATTFEFLVPDNFFAVSALRKADANVPSLLALPYLGCVDAKNKIYKNTRRFVLSEDNPYFFKGTAGEGIGGPHIGYDMVWPMSIIMRAFTSSDDEEILHCLNMLLSTDAGTGFMHESFNKDNPDKFTRSWFAWANTLFGELIVKLYDEGKVSLLNSVTSR